MVSSLIAGISKEECCASVSVGGMMYFLKEAVSTASYGCFSDCSYTREFGGGVEGAVVGTVVRRRRMWRRRRGGGEGWEE